MERFGSKKRGSARNSALVLSMQTPLSSARHGAKDAAVLPQPLFLFRVPLFGRKLCTHKIPDSHSFGGQPVVSAAQRTPRAGIPSSLAPMLGLIGALLLAATFFTLSVPGAGAQTGPNSDPNYVALRNITLWSEAVSVMNFSLKRDAGTFHLNSGTVCFVPPVNGKVTGAVFVGEGNFVLNPPTETERKSLKYLTKEDEFSEKFERLVLRFTDSTYDEIKKVGTPAAGGCDAGLLKDSQNVTRHKIKHNLEAELLGEILSPEPRGLFW